MDGTNLIRDFVALSRFAGARFDLVQAGGGNTSVKLDARRMLVKASGFLLSEVDEANGFATVEYPALAALLNSPTQWDSPDKQERDARIARLVQSHTALPKPRASIEVFLHALLGKFVLHTHPLAVNVMASRTDWNEALAELFPGSLRVRYRSPGVELAMELAQSVHCTDGADTPPVVFLQNHGLIVHGDDAAEVRAVTDKVVTRCERHVGVDFGRYRDATRVADYLADGSIATVCEDRVILEFLSRDRGLFAARPFFPDAFVFCGVVPLEIDRLDDASALQDFRTRYHEAPKVVIHGGALYFIARNVRKAREIEEVFKAHLISLAAMGKKVQFLDDAELAYLGNWEAEKYRKEL